VVLEGVAYALPTVANAVGYSEVVDEGLTGFWSRNEDTSQRRRPRGLAHPAASPGEGQVPRR